VNSLRGTSLDDPFFFHLLAFKLFQKVAETAALNRGSPRSGPGRAISKEYYIEAWKLLIRKLPVRNPVRFVKMSSLIR
jgi:hypothetical protein